MSLTKWLCGSMLINGKFFLHDIHSVTLLQLLQLHGVGNACGCAPWVHSVLILPNFGPMASQKFPSKNAVRLDQVDEVDSHGMIQPCALSIGPLEVHQDVISWRNLYTKILQKSNQSNVESVCTILHRNEHGIHGTFIPPVKATPCCPSRCQPRVGFGHHPVTKTAFKRTRSRPVKRCSFTNGKLPTLKGTKQHKTRPQTNLQGVKIAISNRASTRCTCSMHHSQHLSAARESLRHAKVSDKWSKCMQVYESVLKFVELWSVFSSLSTNAPSIIKQHLYPHLCSWCPQSKPSSKMQNRNDAIVFLAWEHCAQAISIPNTIHPPLFVWCASWSPKMLQAKLKIIQKVSRCRNWPCHAMPVFALRLTLGESGFRMTSGLEEGFKSNRGLVCSESPFNRFFLRF